MIVGMDVDDVVANLVDEWLRRYRVRTAHNIYPEAIRDWDIGQYCTAMKKDDFYAILHEPDLYDRVRPFPQARSVVDRIRENGHRIVFITACVGTSAFDKKEWLVRHGFLTGKHKHNDFVACHDKSLVSAADILCDDRVENVEKFPNKAILVRRPHNEDLMCWRPRGRLYELPDLIEVL